MVNIGLKRLYLVGKFMPPQRQQSVSRQIHFLESNSRINEIVKRIDDEVLDSLEEGASSRAAREISVNFKKDNLNLVIFDLLVDKVPSKDKIKLLSIYQKVEVN